MALSKETLTLRIMEVLVDKFGNPKNQEELQKFASAIASAVVDEITQNAVVNPGTMANLGGGLTGTGTIS